MTSRHRPPELEQAARPRETGGGRWIPAAIFALSCLGTYGVWSNSEEGAERELQSYFDFRVRDANARIHERLRAYEVVLLGARGLFNASDNVERDEFQRYVGSIGLEQAFPGIQGVGYSVVVPPAEQEAHVARVRAEGFPDYQIKPPGERPTYTSIVYLEPFRDRNLRAFGYDMFSEPVRRKAMERARDLGVTAISGKVTLVQETDVDVQAGFLMYVPVYRTGVTPPSVEERRALLQGFTYAPFRMNDLMDGALGEQASDIDLEIFDGETNAGGSLLYDSDRTPGNAAERPLSKTLRLELGGTVWRVTAGGLPGMVEHLGRRSPKLIWIAGITGGLLLSSFVMWLIQRRARAIAEERAAEAHARELQEVNASLEARVARSVEEIRAKDRLLIMQGRQASMGEMIGNIAHQWRQPLNALGLVIANIQDAFEMNDLDAPTMEKLAGDGQRLIRKMSSTIDDFRSFFRPDKEQRAFSVREQVNAAISLVRPGFEAKRIDVRLSAPEDVTLWGTPNEYSQVLLNLLVNAKDAIIASGAEHGTIDIEIWSEGKDGHVRVRDNGGGIPEDVMDRIFEPYFSTKASGTGIGLYMSKTIIEQNMGGKIVARNVAGGAEITLSTPLARKA